MKKTSKLPKPFNVKRRKEELDKLCLDIVRLRDGGVCNWCRKDCGCLQHHHIIPVSVCHNAGRWDLQNMVCLGSGCHIFRINKERVEYTRFIEAWLNDRDLNYDQLLITYRGAIVKFTKDYFETKKKVLEDILLTFRESEEL